MGEGQCRSANMAAATLTQRAKPKLKKLRGAKIMKNERDTPVPNWREKKVTMTMMQLATSAPSAALMMLFHNRIRPSTR